MLRELDHPEDVTTVPDQRSGEDRAVRVGEADPIVVRSVD